MKVQKFKNPHVYYGNWLVESSVQIVMVLGLFPSKSGQKVEICYHFFGQKTVCTNVGRFSPIG
jgi:hypothetical protein